MKGFTFLSGFITVFLTSGIISSAVAQVISDGTTNTTVNTNNNNFNILNGIQKGNNLFHSFKEFSIPKGSSATFDNSIDVVNIINRVTGGNISNIDGLIKANGNANLFLINPAGIVFGENASLDIGGSFLGTTAESVVFEDGFNYSAINPQSEPLLTISVPVGLQMGKNPGAIELNGSGYSLDRLINLALFVDSNSNLQVKSGNTLALVGGNINMTGSRVTTTSGKIELGSVSEGIVNFNSTPARWEFNYKKVSEFGDIKLDRAIIDAIAFGGGSINLQARNISLKNLSNVIIQNQGFQQSGGININATESLEIVELEPTQLNNSEIRAESGFSPVGDISISTKRLILSGGQGIRSFASITPGSDIIIDASESIKIKSFNQLNSDFNTSIETATFSTAKAGDIKISTDNLMIANGARLATITRADGDSGNITIDAKSIEIIGDSASNLSLVSSGSFGQGKAGDLLINTDRLILRDGGVIDSSTTGMDDAGNITINASEFIKVSGIVPITKIPSSIASSALNFDEALRIILGIPSVTTGDSGKLLINTPQLQVLDGAVVSVRNEGTGNAGNLEVNGNSILLDEKGSITAATNSGEGGNISINLQNSLIMRRDSLINTESFGTGNGGNLSINSPVIAGFENSDIIANAVEGNGGQIDIITQGIFGLEFRDELTEESDITASSQFGVNGIVDINNISIDPSTGLVELSVDLADSSQQIASGCSSNTGNTFVSTGRGGIAKNPNQQVDLNPTWSDIRDLSAFRQQNKDSQVATNSNKPAIVEATGFIRNANGEIELVAAQNTPFMTKQVVNCSGINT